MPPAVSPTPIPALLTCGISCLGSAWRAGHGGGAGQQAHPGRRGPHSPHLTGSHRGPRGPCRPCPGQPGILGLRSWEPRGLGALEGSVHSGKSLEALLPHLPWTRVQISYRHTRADADRCARGQPKYLPKPWSQTADGDIRSPDRCRQPTVRGQCGHWPPTSTAQPPPSSPQQQQKSWDLPIERPVYCLSLYTGLPCVLGQSRCPESHFLIWQVEVMTAELVTSWEHSIESGSDSRYFNIGFP